MTTATKLPPYTIRHEDKTGTLTASADDIQSALDAAWQLYRYTETTPIVVVDNHSYVEETDTYDGPPVVIARITVEFLDGQ